MQLPQALFQLCKLKVSLCILYKDEEFTVTFRYSTTLAWPLDERCERLDRFDSGLFRFPAGFDSRVGEYRRQRLFGGG